ncbi:GNAT family N-acetyltransferase [Clostridium tyrobutyricum]|uniref:GNAT family N-acetyltransferase n=1 Tax=Clostridium tyrobutyricum TaxID=1519 RepID=UPI0018AB6533|nr:GNAT family protein [Clostridium tyrobutyricum]
MKDRIFIEGQNIYLRNLKKEDIYENYIHWFDDEQVCRTNSHHRFPNSEQDMIKYIENTSNSNFQLVLGIINKKNEIHIGNVSLQNINYINRSAEFAIIIGEKEYWGKGYGKECGKLIIEHGFSELNLNRVYCGTFSENIGMQKLAEKLGFNKEGIRCEAEFKNGKYVDIIEFGLLKRNWK